MDAVRIDAARRARVWCYALVLTVVAGTLGAAIFRVEPLLSANDRSRWCTIWSLVERGTYQIDEIDSHPAWSTIDKVRHEGHYYSSKPPLLATLYACVYWVVRGLTGWTLSDHRDEVARLILVATHLIPWLAGLAVFARLAERYVATDTARLFLVVTAAFGTLLTAFAVTLNNHTPAAVSVVFAIYSGLRVLEWPKRQESEGRTGESADRTQEASEQSEQAAGAAAGARGWLHAGLAGFFAGFAVTCELPAAAFGGLLFLLLLRHAPWRTLLAFVPLALVPVAALLATNYLVSDGWKPFYAYYGTEKYVYVDDEGVPSYWSDPKGLDRAVDSPAIYLMHCTVGHHGIFSLTPVWLLSLAGWLCGRRWESPLRPFLWIGLITTCVVLGFYLSRPQNYNYGGNCSGLRWMIWVTPLLLIAAAPAVERWGERLWFRCVAVVLLAVSVFSAHASLGNPWKEPWLFTLMERGGWLTQYRPDPPPAFPRPLTTWFRSIPEPLEGGEGPWVEFEGTDAAGRPVVWRLSVEPADRAEDGEELRTIRLVRSTAGEPAIDQPFVVDMARFRAGAFPGEFLRWPGGEPDPDPKADAERLLSGLPKRHDYREGVIRYLKTPARRKAFECQRAARQIDHTPPGSTRAVRTRTDLWLCDEIPFGTALVESKVIDRASGEEVARRRLIVRDYFPREGESPQTSPAGDPRSP